MQREALRAASALVTMLLSAPTEEPWLCSSVLGGGFTTLEPRPGGRNGGGAPESRESRVAAGKLHGAVPS